MLRDKQLGIRFTREEREIIEKHAENRNESIAESVRNAIFSYISQDNLDQLGIDFLKQRIKIIGKSVDILVKNLKQIKKEIDLFEIKEIQKKLS